jgi:hypothetical protein
MLPKNFDLENLDDGIKNLVITLNRIPYINPKTTLYGPTSCEGHNYDGCLRNGWIYFYKPESKRNDLIKTIDEFCKEYTLFNMEPPQIMNQYDLSQLGLNPNQPESFGFHQIEGRFFNDNEKEPSYYDCVSDKQKEAWRENIEIRRKEILSGWNELDSRIKNYIIENITKDIESLPYRSEEKSAESRIINPHCMH